MGDNLVVWVMIVWFRMGWGWSIFSGSHRRYPEEIISKTKVSSKKFFKSCLQLHGTKTLKPLTSTIQYSVAVLIAHLETRRRMSLRKTMAAITAPSLVMTNNQITEYTNGYITIKNGGKKSILPWGTTFKAIKQTHSYKMTKIKQQLPVIQDNVYFCWK